MTSTTRPIGLRVEQSLTGPDIFEVTFQDESPEREATAAFKLGGMLLVRFDTAWQPGLQGLVFQGNITTVESTYDDLGNVVVIRAYDATHRLMHGRRTEAYPMMGFSDVVRKVATRRGVPIGRVDPVPGPPHDHITQADMDDWTFLLTLAEECGYDLFVSEGRLNFQKVAPVVGVAPRVGRERRPLQIMRDDGSLITLRMSVTAGEQVGMIEVRGLDPASKRVIPAKAKVKSAAVASGTGLPARSQRHEVHVARLRARPSVDRHAAARHRGRRGHRVRHRWPGHHARRRAVRRPAAEGGRAGEPLEVRPGGERQVPPHERHAHLGPRPRIPNDDRGHRSAIGLPLGADRRRIAGRGLRVHRRGAGHRHGRQGPEGHVPRQGEVPVALRTT